MNNCMRTIFLYADGGNGVDYEFEEELSFKYYLPFNELTKELVKFIAENCSEWFGTGIYCHIRIYSGEKYIGLMQFPESGRYYYKPAGKPFKGPFNWEDGLWNHEVEIYA